MATVASPNTGRVSAAFAGVAKHYPACRSRCAPRDAATAKAWWKRPTTSQPNAADKPDAVVIVFPAASCQRILQAAAGRGTTVPLVVPGSCAVPRVLSAAGPTVPVASNYTLVPPTGGTPDEQAYRTRVAPADQAPIAQASFSTVLDVRRLLVEAGTTPTSDALRRKLAASHEHPSVMAHPYTCDRKQLPLVTAICNGFVRILSWKNGQLSDATTGRWIDDKQTARLLIGT